MMGRKNRALGVSALALALLLLWLAGIAAADPLVPDIPGGYTSGTNVQENDVLGLGSYFGEAKAVECQPMNPNGPNWFWLSIAALGTGVMIAAVGYILGGFFGTGPYNAFVKGQIHGLLEGAVLLGIASATMLSLAQVGTVNLDTARAYSTIIRNTSAMNFGMVMVANTVMTFFAKQTPQLRVPGLEGMYLGFQMSPMFRPVFDALGMVPQLITVSVVEWTGHEFLLCFIQNSMLTLLLPAGIFMRIFGFKNGANALIGLALALYFIYPWMMILIGDSITTYFQDEIDQLMNGRSQTTDYSLCAGRPICCLGSADATAGSNEAYIQNGRERLSVPKIIEGGSSLLPSGVGGRPYCIYSTGLSRAYGWVIQAWDKFGAFTLMSIPLAGAVALVAEYFNFSFIFLALLVPSILFMIAAVYEAVFFLFIVSIVLPIFSIFVTITMAKEFAKVLGTEIDLSAIEKII